jgi:putative transposase
MLDADADQFVNAERYARDEDRKGYCAGHYDRIFTTCVTIFEQVVKEEKHL